MTDDLATQLLRQLIRAESVTPDRSDCRDILAERLNRLGFDTECLEFEGVRNLWASRKGATDDYLVFCGHTDVVPAGDIAAWQYDPFGAEEDDKGYIYGRGAADMKGSLAAFVTATEQFFASLGDRQLPASLGLLITGDEEGDAIHGTAAVLRELKKRNLRIRHCLVGEPTSVRVPGDTIKNGRRGSLSLQLKLRGKQGHPGYMRSDENVLHRAAEIVDRFAKQRPAGDAPGIVFHLTDIRSRAVAENVTAPEVILKGNWRYTADPGATAIRTEAEQVIAATASDFSPEICWKQGAKPYLCQPGRLAAALQRAITEVCAGEPEFSVAGGVSDGRFFAEYSVSPEDPHPPEVMEFGPRGLGMHESNERIAKDELCTVTRVYRRSLELFFRPEKPPPAG